MTEYTCRLVITEKETGIAIFDQAKKTFETEYLIEPRELTVSIKNGLPFINEFFLEA